MRILLGLALIGCAGETEDTAAEATPAPEPVELQPGWNIIEPGGETSCSRGAPFIFGVREGTVDRVVVEFIGGGACWDEFTCGLADAIFTDNADWLRAFEGQSGIELGIYDETRADNPIADYHHVLIPYCTGDVHWGDADVVYGEGQPNEVTIRHRGAVNARAVLDWMEIQYPSLDQVFLTGCSAGAYGSILWAPHIAEMFPQVDIVQMGDSGVGIITEGWFAESFPSWNAEAALPTHIPGFDPNEVDILATDSAYLYTEIANAYPEGRFSQFNTYKDATQVTYYQYMGGGSQEEWTEQMVERIETIQDGASNFSSFIAPGEAHCIINTNEVYTLESDGVLFIDWIAEMLEGSFPESIDCEECLD